MKVIVGNKDQGGSGDDDGYAVTDRVAMVKEGGDVRSAMIVELTTD